MSASDVTLLTLSLAVEPVGRLVTAQYVVAAGCQRWHAERHRHSAADATTTPDGSCQGSLTGGTTGAKSREFGAGEPSTARHERKVWPSPHYVTGVIMCLVVSSRHLREPGSLPQRCGTSASHRRPLRKVTIDHGRGVSGVTASRMPRMTCGGRKPQVQPPTFVRNCTSSVAHRPPSAWPERTPVRSPRRSTRTDARIGRDTRRVASRTRRPACPPGVPSLRWRKGKRTRRADPKQ